MSSENGRQRGRENLALNANLVPNEALSRGAEMFVCMSCHLIEQYTRAGRNGGEQRETSKQSMISASAP